MDLLRKSHQFSLSLKDLYYQMAHYNQTIGNQQSLLGIHHALENIKNLSNQKLAFLDHIELIRSEKENKRNEIVLKSRKMQIDDEAIKKIAGQIISIDKKDRTISNQMGAMQFMH
jgi:hypothetical protein